MSGPASYTPPMSPAGSAFYPLPAAGSTHSLFSVTRQEASQLVRLTKDQVQGRDCYFLQLRLRTLYSDDVIPGGSIRKLPRLINGIPLGAGFLSRDQVSEIRWRLVEGEHSTLTFLSCPLTRDEAEEDRTGFRDRLITQAQTVFGETTVKASVALSKAIDFQEDIVLNDIAVPVSDGLQFRD